MKICKKCGSQVPDNMRFCKICGEPMKSGEEDDGLQNQRTSTSQNIKEAKKSGKPGNKKNWICSSILILICGFFGVVWLPLEILAILLFVLRLYKKIGNKIWNIILACIIGIFLISGLAGDETGTSQTGTGENVEKADVSVEEIDQTSISEIAENVEVSEEEASIIETQEAETANSTEKIETQYIKAQLEWEYPSTFQKQRREVFDLMADADGRIVEDESGNILEPFYKIAVTTANDIAQSDDWFNYYYYGDMKDNRPNGQGIILTKVSPSIDMALFLPVYAGNFQNGILDGYGIKFYQDSGIEVEGEFLIDDLGADFEGIVPEGKVISYYQNDINEIAKNGSIPEEDLDYYSHMQYSNRSAVLNYPILQPSVNIEGEYQEEWLTGDIKEYYYNYQFNLNDQKYHKMENSVYGPLKYEGEMEHDDYSGKGEVFYLNGQTAFKGNLSDGLFDGEGKIYTKDGKLIYKGQFKGGYIADGDQLEKIIDSISSSMENASDDGYSDELDFYSALNFY